jgi:hypothetical protein
MPDRVIRDELLTSERYWSVSIQAQQCYVHLMLCVDDAARFSGKNFTLRAACYPGQPIDAAWLERMLTELADADLVRCYVFVPRFRNRRRYMARSKYPEPPNEINDLPAKKADSSLTQVIPKPVSSQEERGRRGVGVGEDPPAARVPPTPSARRATKKCPPEFIVAEALKAWAFEKFPRVDVEAETEMMRDHTFATARSDWDGTWRNWIRKAGKEPASSPSYLTAAERRNAVIDQLTGRSRHARTMPDDTIDVPSRDVK